MKHLTSAGLIAISLAIAPVARAQYTANYQTNIISGVTSNWTGNAGYVVGSNTAFDVLQVVSSGVLSNSNASIGYETSGSNNAAYVVGSGSVWISRTNFYVGYNGAGSQLIITNGGQVGSGSPFDGFTCLGYYPSSSNNTALIGGSGSVWLSTNALYVGEYGSGNQLTITNGGFVYTGNGIIGDIGGGNAVTVVGTGSVWRGSLTVGGGSGGNRLTIRDGGAVYAGGLGFIGNGGGSTNNLATVTGSGSIWSNGSTYVGYGGWGNQLIISNGAVVYGNSGSVVGYYPSAGSNNMVIVTDTGSVWSNNSNFDISPGGGPNNRITIKNGGKIWVRLRSTIGLSNNFATVTGSGSTWTIGQDFRVGSSSFGGGPNQVTITNAGQVVDASGYVGYASGSNSLQVVGSNSSWINSANLYVGYAGTSNRLTITSSGAVSNTDGFVGYNGSISAVTINGGSWYNRGNLFVGYSSSSNQLNIGTGSSVVASNACVSYNTGTTGNQVSITGGSLYVTNAAHNAVLEIRCGTITLSSGFLQADIIVMTNSCAQFTRTGGTLIYGTAVLATNLDADGDGMANGWEQAYGLDPLNAADASADNDGDGQSNLQAYLAGTDPTNSASAFRIVGVVATNDDVLVTWATAGGRTNVVQSATDLFSGYTNLSPNIVVSGSGDVTTNWLDAGAVTNGASRYYRIRLVP